MCMLEACHLQGATHLCDKCEQGVHCGLLSWAHLAADAHCQPFAMTHILQKAIGKYFMLCFIYPTNSAVKMHTNIPPKRDVMHTP